MINEEHDIALIDLYLSDEVTQEQKVEIETRLARDADFAKLFEDLRMAVDGIQFQAREKLKEEIGKLEDKLDRAEGSKTFRLRTNWPAALAAIVITGVGVLWYFQRQESTASLFARVFEPYPDVVMPVVRGTEVNADPLAPAFAAYDKGDYEKAASLFQQAPKKDGAVYFYLGNSYLALGNGRKARENLQRLKGSFDVFHEQTDWYIALSYLLEGDNATCRELLLEIRAKNNSYSAKANELLIALDAEKK
jgi:tetratricopeptide (TPR) repeat protein